jgi:hypothetical protein
MSSTPSNNVVSFTTRPLQKTSDVQGTTFSPVVFGIAPETTGRKKGNSNTKIWYILVYRCRRGVYPPGMTTAKDRLRMGRYYDQHPRMALAQQFVEAERKGIYFDPGNITKNVGRRTGRITHLTKNVANYRTNHA